MKNMVTTVIPSAGERVRQPDRRLICARETGEEVDPICRFFRVTHGLLLGGDEMQTKLPLSPQMKAILELLEQDGPMAARQVNDRLYQPRSGQNRRAFAASMSRTLRRMEDRGLIVRDNEMIIATGAGLLRIHPEEFEVIIEQIREAVRQGVDEAFAQLREQGHLEQKMGSQ